MTLLDKRFSQFVTAVKGPRDAAGNIFFCGRLLQVTSDPTTLEKLLVVTVDGQDFSVVDTLENKSKLAVAGILGHELIVMGQRCLEAVRGRQQHEKLMEARAQVKEIWGTWANQVWKIHPRIERSKKCADVVCAVLAVAPQAETPEEIRKALRRQLNNILPREWPEIVKLVKALAAVKKTRG